MVSAAASSGRGDLIQVSRPVIGPEEETSVLDVLRSGWVGQGPKVVEFERELAALLEVEHAVAVSSGTAALHLALLALGVGPGDAVIVPDFTFPASANVVRHCGAEPILLDIDSDSLNLSVNELELFLERDTEIVAGRTLDRRTGRAVKAIMAVHLFGLPLAMEPVVRLAGRYGLAIVEDAACALGARDSLGLCGTIGDVGCFSFHPRKVITTGEGGLLVTRSAGLAATARSLRNQGMCQAEGGVAFSHAGYNFRMSDVNAAIGMAQLGKLDTISERHREIARWYDAELASVEGLRLPARADGRIFQAYVVVVERVSRDAVITSLRAAGVESVRGTYAVSAQPAYEGFSRSVNAMHAQECSLALPLHTGLDRSDVVRVCAALKAALDA